MKITQSYSAYQRAHFKSFHLSCLKTWNFGFFPEEGAHDLSLGKKKHQTLYFSRWELDTSTVGFSDMLNMAVQFLIRFYDFGDISPFVKNHSSFLRHIISRTG